MVKKTPAAIRWLAYSYVGAWSMISVVCYLDDLKRGIWFCFQLPSTCTIWMVMVKYPVMNYCLYSTWWSDPIYRRIRYVKWFNTKANALDGRKIFGLFRIIFNFSFPTSHISPLILNELWSNSQFKNHMILHLHLTTVRLPTITFIICKVFYSYN